MRKRAFCYIGLFRGRRQATESEVAVRMTPEPCDDVARQTILVLNDPVVQPQVHGRLIDKRSRKSCGAIHSFHMSWTLAMTDGNEKK